MMECCSVSLLLLATAAAVPLVDIAPLLHDETPLGASAAAAARRVSAAAAELGVVRLTGHGVDVARALGAARAFFDLPEPAKRSARMAAGAAPGFFRGYLPLASEAGLATFLELKEGFAYGHDGWAAGAAYANPLEGANAWPDANATRALGADWRPTLNAWCRNADGARAARG